MHNVLPRLHQRQKAMLFHNQSGAVLLQEKSSAGGFLKILPVDFPLRSRMEELIRTS